MKCLQFNSLRDLMRAQRLGGEKFPSLVFTREAQRTQRLRRENRRNRIFLTRAMIQKLRKMRSVTEPPAWVSVQSPVVSAHRPCSEPCLNTFFRDCAQTQRIAARNHQRYQWAYVSRTLDSAAAYGRLIELLCIRHPVTLLLGLP